MANAPLRTMVFHFPFRVQEAGGQHIASCDPLRLEDRATSQEAALKKLARSLDLFLQVSIARGTVDELVAKLTRERPKKPFVSMGTVEAGGFRVDFEQAELLIPLLEDLSPKRTH
jgi:hypothetical protein